MLLTPLSLRRPQAYLDLEEARAKCGPAADVLQESYLSFLRGANLLCVSVCVCVCVCECVTVCMSGLGNIGGTVVGNEVASYLVPVVLSHDGSLPILWSVGLEQVLWNQLTKHLSVCVCVYVCVCVNVSAGECMLVRY